MDCGEEVAAIERALKPLAEVSGIKADIPNSTVSVSHADGLSPQKLIEAIRGVGLTASVPSGGEQQTIAANRRMRLLLVATSGSFLAAALISQWLGLLPDSALKALELLSVACSGYLIFPKAVNAIRVFRLDMNVLMTVAVFGALILGDWAEAATVVFLFAVSELLESYSVSRARNAISSLLKLTPETALRKDGTEAKVEEIKFGEIIIVRPGARVPLDGEVTLGASYLNQAPITGESMPVEKKAGDTVFAGTINGDGTLELRVTKISSDTTLARILHMVEEAQSQKAPSQRFVDTFARYYTPTVFVLAILVALLPPLLFAGSFTVWFYRALVLLVIGCPCALVISTPVSVVSGLTAMARKGVLIKGGTYLEAIGKLRALALDKTGTLTEGTPRVLEVISVNQKSETEILQIAASVDAHSDHPLAQAVVAYAKEKQITFPTSENYQSKSGRGAQADIAGHPFFVGNHRFTHELAVCSEELEKRLTDIESQARSVVVVGHIPHAGCRGEVLGVLAVGDSIRAGAKDAIEALRKVGLAKIIMLSGDNQRTADAIGKQVGVDQAIGDLLPDDKIEHVKKLLAEYHEVGMVGDGVNDAPALSAASVGIAMGAIGTDTAIETADIALMHDDLGKLADVVLLGRRTLGTIRANIAFAIGVKLIFLVLAVFGATSLWLAIFADTGATLLVIANSLRLLKA